MAPSQALLQPDEVLAGERTFAYRIIGLLGSGGQGQVYQACNILDEHTPVALKVSTNPEQLEQEARLHSSLHHHSMIPQMFAHGSFAIGNVNVGYLATEYLPNSCTLEIYRTHTSHGVLPTHEAMWVGLQLCEVLAYLHRHGVIHRDIKPQNILITAQRRIRLIDFGCAALINTPGEGGTHGYIAPEEILGHCCTPAGDVFSLGATLQAMLTSGSVWDTVRGWRWTHLGDLIRDMLRDDPTCRPSLHEVQTRLGTCYRRDVLSSI